MSRPIPLVILGLGLAVGRLASAGDGAVPEPRASVIMQGTLVADEGPRHTLLGYTIVVESGSGHPPVITRYKLVTTNIKQPSALADAVSRTVRVLGRVGERPDQHFLLVEALLEP